MRKILKLMLLYLSEPIIYTDERDKLKWLEKYEKELLNEQKTRHTR